MYKSYLNDPITRKSEVIPVTFDIVFKRIMTIQKEYLADIINYITGIPREDIIEEGIAKGISQGINQNKIATAKNMLKMNLDIQIISKATGLSKDEIEQIN